MEFELRFLDTNVDYCNFDSISGTLMAIIIEFEVGRCKFQNSIESELFVEKLQNRC